MGTLLGSWVKTPWCCWGAFPLLEQQPGLATIPPRLEEQEEESGPQPHASAASPQKAASTQPGRSPRAGTAPVTFRGHRADGMRP